jgi:drug/metabolite transporter (DMT)-like permease
VLLLPWLYIIGFSSLKTSVFKAHMWRAVIGFVSMFLWFVALKQLALPLAVSLSFTSPLFGTVLAVLFFKERLGWHRIAALICGFIGMLLIIRPEWQNMSWPMVLVLTAACMWAVIPLILKHLSSHDKPIVIVFYMVAIMVPLSVPLFLWDPVWLNGPQLGAIMVISFATIGAQLGLTYALKMAPITVILPLDYFRLLFVTIMAQLFFGESVTVMVASGALVIVVSTVYITHREARRKRADENIEFLP